MPSIQVSVVGSGSEHEERAEEVGRLLAERGCTVVCGGGGEVMAAAARGANEWIDHVVVTGIGHARNLAVAASGDAVIAVGGEWGTLAEIAFARRLGRPVVILEPGWELEGVPRAATARDAVELALGSAGRRSS
jgi:predicted Rossmann-fold nucleotide-binding protein